MGGYATRLKRCLDFVIALFALLVLLPVFLVISIVIKLDSSGPIVFKQKRLGYKGKVFNIYKFRTMCVGAENSGDGLIIKSDSDARITKVGNFLRKSSLDELPQLLNIVKGDMAIVGPRPPVVYFPYNGYEQYPKWAKKRFIVRPGITGLAQIKVRNSVPWDERIKYDIDYIDKQSIMLDLKIIFLTAFRIIKPKGIYLEDK
jgi:undecaprenyl phosphate N,N'-diacetylbacillosamine 1-phosphate transferase